MSMPSTVDRPSSRLWVVATPLGNPGDLSPRAREILGSVDSILAEDTRRAGTLLAACGIAKNRLVAFHDHNEDKKLPVVLEELAAGKSAALISDAGTPLLSDPGFTLVRACREKGISVSPIPGPSAPVAALSASGLPPLPYAFLGFAPRRPQEIMAFFTPYAYLPLTLIFFERKDRLAATLAVAREALGSRRVCIARELTKTYEEFLFLTLGDAVPPLLGEITVLIGPPHKGADDDGAGTPGRRLPEAEALARLRVLRNSGLKIREAAKLLHGEGVGWSVKELYDLLQRKDADACGA